MQISLAGFYVYCASNVKCNGCTEHHRLLESDGRMILSQFIVYRRGILVYFQLCNLCSYFYNISVIACTVWKISLLFGGYALEIVLYIIPGNVFLMLG